MISGTLVSAAETTGAVPAETTMPLNQDETVSDNKDTTESGDESEEKLNTENNSEEESSGSITDGEAADDMDESAEESADNTEESENNTITDDTVEETVTEGVVIEETEESDIAAPDAVTQELVDMYLQFLNRPVMLMSRGRVGTYESELAAFPADYQAKLKALHEKHPNWIFVAVNTGLSWKDVVDAEYSNKRSLIQKSQSSLLLSKASGHYDSSTGAYVPIDGSTWVTAAKQAVTYYADPRNFLNENYIFMFEALDFNNAYHKIDGVKSILAGTELSNKKIRYIDTSGKTVEIGDLTYEGAIYAAGADTGVSPLFLASKIKQETGAKLSNGSISGDYSYNGTEYTGYYNYYNIGATSTSTGSAVANGLTYAKGSGSYSRPWTSPVLAIKGGAQFLAESYIAKGQNTTYFQKFNTIVKPYYSHQYMQNLTAAASEGRTNYNAYVSQRVQDNAYVFYIPVYNNMPSQSSKVVISGAASKGKAKTTVNMRKGPSVGTDKVTSIPSGAVVTIDEGCFTDETQGIYNQLAHPYWFKVTYGSYTGYVSASYLILDSTQTISVGSTTKLSVSGIGSGEAVYYDSSDPTVVSVDLNGNVKGLKEGNSTIYAISGSGKSIDAIGITVGKGTTTTTPITPEPQPETKTYTKYKTTTSVNYRDGAGTSYAKKGTLSKGTAIEVEDGYSKKANGYTWVRFKLNGKEYYVANNYIEKIATVSKPVTDSKTYTKAMVISKVNYRSGASTSSKKAGTLKQGASIQVENGYSKKANGYTWVRFKIGMQTYYVASEYVKKYSDDIKKPTLSSAKYSSGAITVNWKKVSGVKGYYVYRKESGGSWSRIKVIKSGSTVKYKDSSIKSGKKYIYTVRAYTADKVSDCNTKGVSATAKKAKTTYTTYVTKSKVNYRTAAGLSKKKGGTFAKGKKISVENGYSKKVDGYTWYRFKMNGKNYYIVSKYVKKK